MRRDAKVDANQALIVGALQSIGATVQSLAPIGKGCPDLLVGFRGKTLLMEVKDGSRSPSRQVLTQDQIKWHGAWKGGPVSIVRDVEGAIRALRVTITSEVQG